MKNGGYVNNFLKSEESKDFILAKNKKSPPIGRLPVTERNAKRIFLEKIQSEICKRAVFSENVRFPKKSLPAIGAK